MAYLLDTNVFIHAKNLHYGFDICPGFWEWLDQANASGKVMSIERVAEELTVGDDELSAWAADRADRLFLRPDPSSIRSLRAVSSWVTSQDYDPAGISLFLQVADYYLVAQAHAGGHIVVTHERASGSKRRIKIPEVCIGLGVHHISPFQMLRSERVQLVLRTRRQT